MIYKSEFITITYRTKNINLLEFQFIYQPNFIEFLKQKIPHGRHRVFIAKDNHKNTMYRNELERTIYTYDIYKRYWKRLYKELPTFFRNIYIIKNGNTYELKLINNKIILIKPKERPKDEYVNIEDYEKKKYKIYRDR